MGGGRWKDLDVGWWYLLIRKTEELQVWMENEKFCFEEIKLGMPVSHSSGEVNSAIA